MNVDFIAGFLAASMWWGVFRLGRYTYRRIKAWRIAREEEVADLRTRVTAFKYAMDRYDESLREFRDAIARERASTKEC